MSPGHCHVLVAEDDENDAFLLMRAFRKSGLGLAVFRVADGTEAVDYLGGTGAYTDRALFPLPKLVLLDLKMPKMSGFEVLAWMRTRPALVGLPTVVLSSSTLPSDLAKARELGAKDYKIKPMDFQELVRLVQDLNNCYLHQKAPQAMPDA